MAGGTPRNFAARPTPPRSSLPGLVMPPPLAGDTVRDLVMRWPTRSASLLAFVAGELGDRDLVEKRPPKPSMCADSRSHSPNSCATVASCQQVSISRCRQNYLLQDMQAHIERLDPEPAQIIERMSLKIRKRERLYCAAGFTS